MPARAAKVFAPEVRQFLQTVGTDSRQATKIIVTYKKAPSAPASSRMSGRAWTNLRVINGAAFTVSANKLADLANDSNVMSVSLDHTLKGFDDYTDTVMGASSFWNLGYDGSGIGVAVIDSGINDSHADFTNSGNVSRVVYHQDFTGTTTYQGTKQVWDLYGHGTHVAGIIGGAGKKSGGRFAGVAPNVNLVDLRVLDGNGSGSDSMVIGNSAGDQSEKHLQHPRDQLVTGPRNCRGLCAGSVVPGGGIGVESGYSRGSGRGKLWTYQREWQQRLRHSRRAGKRSAGVDGGRDEGDEHLLAHRRPDCQL
jgi:subtilisin family serine protease